MDLAALLAELFPIVSSRITLEIDPASLRRDTGPLVATLRLVRGGDDDGTLEREVDLVYAPNVDDPRLPAYLTGWANALRSLLARLDALEMVGALSGADRAGVDALGPEDLVYPAVLYMTHLDTPAGFEHALLFGAWRLGRWLPDSLDVAAAFVDELPISAGRFTVELVPETVDEDTGEILGGFHENAGHGLTAVLRVTVWDGDGDARTPREVREAAVSIARSEHAYDLRLPAYFAGWAAALRTLFERHAALDAGDARRAALEAVEPEALVCPQVLALGRPQTAEGFAAALLADRRLGRLLPPRPRQR